MNFSLSKLTQHPTPFYYYDLSLLRATLQEVNQCLAPYPNFHVHFAIKANANPQLLRIIANAGLGADCVSGGEIEVARANGFSSQNIVFAGVGKSDKEICTALREKIYCFNVESLAELEVINQLAKQMDCTANIAFRVNPNVDAHTHAKITTGLNENKFGIAIEDLLPAIQQSQTLNHVKFIGLHFHIGSQILDLSVFEALCSRINELQLILNKEQIKLDYINVGGGLGVDYEKPDENPISQFQNYFKIFATHLHLKTEQHIHFELGRSIVAQCGSLISRALYIKKGHTKNFLIVDAGFTDLIRPAMYGAHHFTQNLSATNDLPQETYDVVGPICESSDVFSTNEVLPLSHRGDLIAFRSAGAYGECMASTYNCRNLPQSFFEDVSE